MPVGFGKQLLQPRQRHRQRVPRRDLAEQMPERIIGGVGGQQISKQEPAARQLTNDGEDDRIRGGPPLPYRVSDLGRCKTRGEGQHAEHDLPIVAGGQSELRLEDDLYAEQAALVHATSQPALQQWTGVATSDLRLTDLELWLAQLGGVCRLINRRPGHGLAPAVGAGGSLAVLAGTGDTFAYFTFGPEDGGGQCEIGINAYGPRAAGLAERVAGRVRAWAADRPRLATWIELYPIDVPVPSLEDVLLDVPKDHVRIIVRTAPRSGLAGS